jgi:hypothetical protein
LKLNVDSFPLGLAGLGGAGSLSPARAEETGLTKAAKATITLMSKAIRALVTLAMLSLPDEPAGCS